MVPVRTLDKVRALIARTSSSYEEEARTSAVIACRLIREHGIELRAPAEPQEEAAPKSETRTAWAPREVRFVHQSRFAGRCLWCGELIPAGSRIAWYPIEKTVAHDECHWEACR